MKIKNLVLIDMINKLQAYSAKKLPQKISYAITRNMMELAKEYQAYDTELKKLFDSYGEYLKFGKDGVPIVDDKVKDEFNSQIMELLNIEIEITPHYIDQNAFDYDDNGVYDALSAQDIVILQSVLCDTKTS